MNVRATELTAVTERAVDACTRHVDAGGLPFVGFVINAAGDMLSQFGVNQVHETGDPTAHAELVAITTHRLDILAGTMLLATGEPCGQYTIDHGIDTVYVAVDRDEVADLGFDYRASYPVFGITDTKRSEIIRHLAVDRGIDSFTHYLNLYLSGHALAGPGTVTKGQTS